MGTGMWKSQKQERSRRLFLSKIWAVHKWKRLLSERCGSQLCWYREHGFNTNLIVTTEIGSVDCQALLAIFQQT